MQQALICVFERRQSADGAQVKGEKRRGAAAKKKKHLKVDNAVREFQIIFFFLLWQSHCLLQMK